MEELEGTTPYMLLEPESDTPETAEVTEPVQEQPSEPETVTEEIVEAPAVEEPNFYTPEEVARIATDGGEIDLAKLTPEGQMIYKSVQRGLTPKLQEAAEIKRQMSAIQEEMAQYRQMAMQAPMRQENLTVEQVAQHNPEAALAMINQQLMQEQDPFEKTNLLEKKMAMMELVNYRSQQAMAYQAQAQNTVAAVKNAIPEFGTDYQKELTDFAVNSLGYTDQELKQLTDVRLGDVAVKNIKSIHKLYQAERASKSVESKQVKAPPPQVERPGSGFNAIVKNEAWEDDNYFSERNKRSLM